MASSDVRQKVFRVPAGVVLSVGLTWDYRGASPVDLDLSAVCFTKEGQLCDVVFFNHLFPEGTDEAALRAQYLLDPEELPYMFLSGDSTVGGEEENQLSGLALASRRRHQMMTGCHRPGKRSATAAAESLFHRLYEEQDLTGVQEAVEEYYTGGGEIVDENGVLVRRGPRRELCDEVLTLVAAKMPAQAEVVFICVSSYTGQDFSALAKVRLTIHNETMDERVGTMDLKSTTGSGTANLAAMFVRVPPDSETGAMAGEAPTAFWDLRELNVRTYGYTFVDVLPLMLDVLGVPANSRRDALAYLPDYPLGKNRERLAAQPLSDLRFGLGWDGEHDLDAFAVMLDEQNNYVDHVYPKQGRLRSSVVADMARHSGDALTGTNTNGDEEFVDLLTYRVPPSVRTIMLGCTYMESFGAGKDRCESIYDVPNLYMRLQNRTLENPFSFEVDRWDVRKDFRRAQAAEASEGTTGARKDAGRGDGGERVSTVYRAEDRTTQPVRALLMGVLVKTGTVPFEALFPSGRRIDQHFRRPERDDVSTQRENASLSRQTVLEAAPDAEVPLFELVPIHQSIPVDPREGFERVTPLLQCVSAFLCGSGPAPAGGANSHRLNATHTARPTMPGTAGGTLRGGGGYVLDRENNMVGWDHSTKKAVGGQGAVGSAYRGIWRQIQDRERLSERIALEVRFLEVLALEPQLPDRFRCHGEAWVCGQSDTLRGRSLNRRLKTPFLVNRDRMSWDRSSSAAARTFLVHKYDRVRVMLYEFAAFGYADIDLMQMPELWQGGGRPVECSVALLGGGALSRGEVRVRLTRVAYAEAVRALEKESGKVESRQRSKARADREQAEASQNSTYNPCTVM